MTEVRFAIVGQGNIGRTHKKSLEQDVPGAKLSAIVTEQKDLDVVQPVFATLEDALSADAADVFVIATPTMTHVDYGQAVLAAERHLVLEKPCAMTAHEARQLSEAVPDGCIASVMLNQRYHPIYRAIKTIIESGEIGEIVRFNWIMTKWYRPDVYFLVSPWRGTWPGEGGGALMNQCIHNLDVLQWWLGVPQSVVSKVSFGRYHTIDVEDEVTAILSYESGMNGVVVASTGEAPGVNQLDIVGDRGALSYDGERLTVKRTVQSVREFSASTKDMFGMPDFALRTQHGIEGVNQHACVFQNVVDAIQSDRRLETPLSEGVASIALANAILLSAWEDQRIDLPFNDALYERHLTERKAMGYREAKDVEVSIDMDASYR